MPEEAAEKVSGLGFDEILDRLPHRYPFLLVDRVLELERGKRVVAIKNVTANEPFFQGHFPGRPVMPGVLVCEALFQAGGLAAATPGTRDQREVLLAALEKARFRRVVEPGDQLRLEVEVLWHRREFWKMRGRALVEGEVAVEAEFLTTERARS